MDAAPPARCRGAKRQTRSGRPASRAGAGKCPPRAMGTCGADLHHQAADAANGKVARHRSVFKLATPSFRSSVGRHLTARLVGVRASVPLRLEPLRRYQTTHASTGVGVAESLAAIARSMVAVGLGRLAPWAPSRWTPVRAVIPTEPSNRASSQPYDEARKRMPTSFFAFPAQLDGLAACVRYAAARSRTSYGKLSAASESFCVRISADNERMRSLCW